MNADKNGNKWVPVQAHKETWMITESWLQNERMFQFVIHKNLTDTHGFKLEMHKLVICFWTEDKLKGNKIYRIFTKFSSIKC